MGIISGWGTVRTDDGWSAAKVALANASALGGGKR